MDNSFEELKTRYQPALNMMRRLGVQLVNLNMVGNKLLIRGIAPSKEAKNRLWDEIKLIDTNYPDLICDISVSDAQPAGNQPAAVMTAGMSATGGQHDRQYTVRPGDTLSKISRAFYGDADQSTKIVEANRSVLTDPNAIRPGQTLVIPD